MTQSDRPWQEVIELLDTAVFLTDGIGTIIYANPAGAALAHRITPEVMGARITELFAELSAVMGTAEHEGLRRSQPIQLCFPGGVTELYDVSVKPHKYELGKDGFLVSLHELPQDLHRSMSLQRSVSDLMPTFLHELKNPLAAIATSVELLLEDLDEGDIHDELTAIFGEIRRMKLVLDGVGLAGRQLRTRGAYAPVHESLREACMVLQPLAKRKGVSLKTVIPEYSPLPFDVAVLKAVLFNLVMNAIHACSPTNTIRVMTFVGENVFQLIVQDNGHGMSEEILKKCTELFFTTKASGSGIGLALCHEVAAQAQGMLKIRSREGHGTKVTFEVPIELDRIDARSSMSAAGTEQ